MLSVGSETVTTMPDGPRYNDDFYAWTQHQAMVLRTMAVADNRFDRENVAEELEALGRSERDAVRSEIRRILERHKGTIRVESKIGEGATFFFELPNEDRQL